MLEETGVHQQLRNREAEKGGDGCSNLSFIGDITDDCRRQNGTTSDHQSDVIIEMMTPPTTPIRLEEVSSTTAGEDSDDGDKDKTLDCHVKEPVVGWLEVFRFASATDRLLCVLGTVAAVAHGAVMPLLCWVFGIVVDEFVNPDEFCKKVNLTNVTLLPFINVSTTMAVTTESAMDKASRVIEQLCVIFAILGAGSFIVSFVQSHFWMLAAENQVNAIRKAYFINLLRQDCAWYDEQEMGALTARFIEDIAQISRGIGEKIGLFVQNMGSFVGCTIIGLYTGWKLCLVTLSLTPLNFLASYLMVRVAFSQSNSEAKAYANAGAIAQEVLSSIRTVTAFGRQSDEVERYASNLKKVKKVGIRSGLYTGVVMGAMYFFLIAAYAIGFAYGAILINDPNEGYTLGKAVLVIWAVLEGTYAFGYSLTAIRSLATSRVAAYRVFKITDRKPPIDPFSSDGIKCNNEQFASHIEFRDVFFSYPTRPDVTILRGVSLVVETGTTVALVGASGCGKSTIIQLLQRYYDPDVGQVLVGGHDLRDYNVSSFRSLIGCVSQEPILFATTIGENIRYGFSEANQTEIESAANLANAHEFISTLPLGYDTMVGEQGAQLSGGQKQRIAIARALIRNPRILLLDEATSALDTESEAFVQEALDRARAGRSTIVIAHRLSTIMNADKIVVLEHGQIIETGTHGELMANHGTYAKLVEAQQGNHSGPIETDAKAIQQRRAALITSKKMTRNCEAEEITSRKRRLTFSEQKKKDAKVVRKHYSAMRLWRIASDEISYYLVGSLGAAVCGVVWPAFAIIIGRIIHAFSACTAEERFEESLTLSCVLLGIAGAMFAGFLLMFTFFGIAGERIVLRIRKMSFRAMLHQDMAWFDNLDNSPGALTSRLAIQATCVKEATGAQLGQIVIIISGMTASLVIAFLFDWRITLIMAVCAPLSLISGIIQAIVFGDSAAQDKFIEEMAKVLAASTTNVKLVAALGLYQRFLDQFETPLQKRHKKKLVKIIVIAICFGVVEIATMGTYAAGFYAASFFVRWGVTDFGSVFTAVIAIMFNSYFIGQANAMVPDQAKAHLGVAEIFKLLDRKPKICWQEEEDDNNDNDDDDDQTSHQKLQPERCAGKASFNSVEFCYPSRKASHILRGLDLKLEPGQTVALVGSSGCGKSTLIQLLERFYDPTAGDVHLDDNPLSSFSLPWARGKMALVQQEPILFDRTIAENIIYGAPKAVQGQSASAHLQRQVEAAARMANIHGFIASLPNGYNTRVGQHGGKLSGGQKQRIAIARALIRQPKLLLLDEATSALDSESEKTVQNALDTARAGRTVLMIAHRLSTVEHADVIAVLQGGVVSELGKHAELIEKKGVYYNLWSAQQLSVS